MPRHSTRGWIVARYGDQLFCQDAPEHSCHNFSFVTSTKGFQPAHLRIASAAINRILDLVRDGDHTLVLLDTGLQDANQGHALLLAYLDREEPHIPAADRVDFGKPEAEIREGLGLPGRGRIKPAS